MTIVLVTGPSGSGKDSLLTVAKKHYKDDRRVHFANRYVTRSPDANEQNFFVDRLAFSLLEKQGYFLSHWQAHGNLYGVPKTELAEGEWDGITVVSISRTKVTDFERHFDRVVTLNISVPPEILRKRLRKRNREDLEDIEKRLSRNNLQVTASQAISFDNSKDLSVTANRFVELLDSFLP